MNTNYATELEPRVEAATARSDATTAGFIRLWQIYQWLGLNPEQALAATRADVACGAAESATVGDV
jgi:hypothetical protein